jgi:uncharacterized membrane protein
MGMLGVIFVVVCLFGLAELTASRRAMRRLERRLEALEARLATHDAHPAANDQERTATTPVSRSSAPATFVPAFPSRPATMDPSAGGGVGQRPSDRDEAAAALDASSRLEADAASTPSDTTSSSPRFSAPDRAAPSASLEERLGARWSVLVGGAALAIGALLLVRWSFQAGLIGPGARVILGLLFGAALVGGGEFARRRGLGDLGLVSIPATLTAAGTVALFGAVYAAHALYDFIGPAVAFIALGAVGLGAMAAAALHGPLLAGVGLVGAMVAPLLVSSRAPSPWPVAIYIVVVAASGYGLARLRRWMPMAMATLVGASLWQAVLLLSAASGHLASAALTHGLAQSWLALAAFTLPYRGFALSPRSTPSATLAPLAPAALTAATIMTALEAATQAFPSLVGLALIATLALAGVGVSVAAPLAGAAGLFALAFAFAWPASAAGPIWMRAEWSSLALEAREPWMYWAFVGLAGAIVAGLCWARLRREASALSAAIWGASGAATPLGLLALAYVRDRAGDPAAWAAPAWGWASVAAALAALFALAAAQARAQGFRDAAAAQATGWSAAGALGALALGLSFALSEGSLTVALALAALGAAFVAMRLDIAALRWGVAALGGIVAIRLGLNPRVSREVGTTPILNWLLIGYGVPAAAFAFASRLLRGRDDLALQIARSLAVAFAGFLVFFEIRHALNGGDIASPATRLTEVGLQTTSALVFGIGLTLIGGRKPPLVYRVATGISGVLAGVAAVFGLFGSGANPLITDEALAGGTFFNELILGYALPALAAAALAIVARPISPLKARIAAAGALTLVFAYASLQTRAWFMGERIGFDRGASDAEITAYSAVWLVLGLAALAYGVLRGSKEARIGSAVFVLMATLKVFLYDLAGVDGAWRAISFMGLGLTLIGVGFVYQRLIFPKPRPRAPEDEPATPG